MTPGSVSVSGGVASICFHRHRLPAAPQPPSARVCARGQAVAEHRGHPRPASEDVRALTGHVHVPFHDMPVPFHDVPKAFAFLCF